MLANTMRFLLAVGVMLIVASAGYATEKSKVATTSSFKLSQCYPYIVPDEYLKVHGDDGSGLVQPFAPGLHVVLVQDLHGLVKNVTPAELAQLKISPQEAHATALSNLERLLKSREIKLTAYPTGPGQKPFIVIGYHWAAAACILLPRSETSPRRIFTNRT